MAQTLKTIAGFLRLLYFSIVQDIRKSDGNAIRGLLKSILQTLLLMAVFIAMMEIMDMRRMAIRGNFILYMISGIFLFFVHVGTVGKVSGSGDPTNSMLLHAPVTTLLLILSGAFSVVYIQVLSVSVILLFTHILYEPVFFYNFKGFALCFFGAWFSGLAIGLLFLSLQQFLPHIMPIVSSVYRRANMIFSGKMFVANTLPSFMLPLFDWNPLFHLIDQARGHVFINYSPYFTNIQYPFYVSFVLIAIGLMFEHWGRKYVSASWSARR